MSPVVPHIPLTRMNDDGTPAQALKGSIFKARRDQLTDAAARQNFGPIFASLMINEQGRALANEILEKCQGGAEIRFVLDLLQDLTDDAARACLTFLKEIGGIEQCTDGNDLCIFLRDLSRLKNDQDRQAYCVRWVAKRTGANSDLNPAKKLAGTKSKK